MDSAKIIKILALVLTMKATIGQKSENCICYPPHGSYPCTTRGCSAGTNPDCNYGGFSPFYYVSYFIRLTGNSPSFGGCNCPDSPYNLRYNGLYIDPTIYTYDDYFNYTTCTDFSGNARDADGNVPPGVNDATDCCNFCCNRNDPYPTNTTTTTMATTPTTTGLSPECYNPDGSSCEWYNDCLEKKYPCRGESTDYALEYATKFCELYTEHYNTFTETGQHWIDAVRRCLQVNLVPLIREVSINVTCEKIRDVAFASHTPCYLHPNPGAPSICDLDLADWWKIFWTIKSSFLTDAVFDCLKGAYDTFSTCVRKIFEEDTSVRLVMMSILGTSSLSASKSDMNSLAGLIADEIVKMEVWDLERLDYFPYSADTWVVRAETDQQQITIKILIADKFALDNIGGILIANVADNYLNQTIGHLVQSIQQGKLELRTTDGTFYVKQMDKCLDVNCNETDGNPAIAPPYSFAIRLVNSSIFLIIALLCFLLLKK